jgi:hypothetical protein
MRSGSVRICTRGLTFLSNLLSKNARIARKHWGSLWNHNPRVGGSSPSSGIVVFAGTSVDCRNLRLVA